MPAEDDGCPTDVMLGQSAITGLRGRHRIASRPSARYSGQLGIPGARHRRPRGRREDSRMALEAVPLRRPSRPVAKARAP
jgi:hypothetical protein